MDGINDAIDLSSVEETGLFTLFNRAIESRSEDPILRDEKAEELVDRIDPLLKKKSGKMARQLRDRSIDPRLTVHIALRARKYDDYARDFLSRNPDGVIVNIGCGMDTRFFRIDNGRLQFFDIDLPELIRFKRKLLAENDRYHMIGQSVLDHSWMKDVEKYDRRVLFLAEGLFMYLPEEKVKKLILDMQERFPESELVCELTNRTWVEGFWGKLTSMKLKNRMKIGADAAFTFGVDHPNELETWGDGIEFVEQWFYMDDDHPKIGWMRIFKNIAIFRNAQYTARYILHGN